MRLLADSQKKGLGELPAPGDWSDWNQHQPSLGLGRRTGGPDILLGSIQGGWAEG